MHSHTQFKKKFISSLVGVASVSSLVLVPEIGQANSNFDSSDSSTQSIFAQSTQRTASPSPRTTTSPGTTPSPSPRTTTSPGTTPSPSPRTTTSPGTTQSPSPRTTTSPGTTQSPSPRTTTSPGTTTSPRTTTPNHSPTARDKEFMTKAAQSDQTEIQTSKLALQRSKNQSVREYAQNMIQHHTNSSQKLTQIAKKKNFPLPTDIGTENKALLTKLSNLNGAEFDKAYMNGQVQAHQRTLAEYQSYLKQGQDPELKAFASQVEPIVASHLATAKNQVGNTVRSGSGR
jgi:putative membrane protein